MDINFTTNYHHCPPTFKFTLELLPPIASLLRYITFNAPPLEQLLLAVCIFVVTREETADTTTDHIAMEKALCDENAFFLWLEGKNLTSTIGVYYSHICAQLIMYACRNPDGTIQLQYALENLDPIIDLIATVAARGLYEVRYKEQPFFDLLPILLPKPAHFTPFIDGDVHVFADRPASHHTN